LYIDTAHQQFQEKHLPEVFKGFQGFIEYRKYRNNKPRMSAKSLVAQKSIP
jgi:hypothetical protein